jgi:hypothetical protein
MALRRIFLLGVAVRVIVGWFLAPANNDPHLEFIQFLVREGRLPFADELTLGFQPPLYYLLAAPLWWLSGSAKVVQLLSLLLSILNLGLIVRFIEKTPLIESQRGRAQAALLSALLPQFVLFSAFVSNDALAFVVGTWLFLCLVRWIERPTGASLALLGVVQGIGLSTKGTFLAYLPIAAAAIAAVLLHRRQPPGRVVAALAWFGLLAGLLGGYKFAENYQRFGTPVVSNDELEQAWLVHQQGTWQGPSSLVDLDVTKLVREPWIAESNRHSIPLLLYGTFWWSLIRESNFEHTRALAAGAIPRAICVLALVPTLLLLAGAGRGLWRACCPRREASAPEEPFRERAVALVALLALAGQFALVLSWGFKHDAWSFFQSRLAFAAFLSIALLLAWGFDALAGRPKLARAGAWAVLGLHAAFAAYYAAEIAVELLET